MSDFNISKPHIIRIGVGSEVKSLKIGKSIRISLNQPHECLDVRFAQSFEGGIDLRRACIQDETRSACLIRMT